MNNPVILVTGGSRGIGLAIVRQLVESFSARVITISRTISNELSALSERLPNQVTIIQGDITDESIHAKAVSTALNQYNRLDGIVLNAGVIDPIGRVASGGTVNEWKALFDINLFALVHTIQAAVPHLRQSKGRIVLLSSGASIGGSPGWGPYSASKAALNSLGRTLGNEEPEITTIAVRPGVVDTEMISTVLSEGAAHMSETDHQKFTNLRAEGKLLKPELPAHVIAGLSLKAPRELSGQFVSWDAEELKDFRL